MSIFSKTGFALILTICGIGMSCSCDALNLNKKDEVQPAVRVDEKIYFDPDDFPMGEDSFHIHIGCNEWIQTSTVHRDVTGFFTYSADIYCVPGSLAYQKQWKCPYCNLYWPMGKPCGNPDCPSRFK